jgi:hypothetical protein
LSHFLTENRYPLFLKMLYQPIKSRHDGARTAIALQAWNKGVGPSFEWNHIFKEQDMIKLATAAGAALIILAGAPSSMGSASAQADGIKLAQVDLDVNVRPRRERRERNVDVTIGRRGVEFEREHRRHCRVVTTTVERGDRTIRKTERRCD